MSDKREDLSSAFDLDHVDLGLLDESDGRLDALGCGGLEGSEGEIGDEEGRALRWGEGVMGGEGDGGGVVDERVEGEGGCGAVAETDLGE